MTVWVGAGSVASVWQGVHSGGTQVFLLIAGLQILQIILAEVG